MQLKYNGDTGENFVDIWNKMAAISQPTPCCIRIHFTLGQHWLVYWSGANLARNHHANQWWHILPVHYYASFGFNELSRRISPQRQPLVAMGTLFMKIPSANSGYCRNSAPVSGFRSFIICVDDLFHVMVCPLRCQSITWPHDDPVGLCTHIESK